MIAMRQSQERDTIIKERRQAKRREKYMLRYTLILSTLIGAILLAAPQVMAQGRVEGFRLCPGVKPPKTGPPFKLDFSYNFL